MLFWRFRRLQGCLSETRAVDPAAAGAQGIHCVLDNADGRHTDVLCAGAVGHSVVEIVAVLPRCTTRTPVAIGVAAMAGNVLLNLWLRAARSCRGARAGGRYATSVEMALLISLLSQRLQGLEWPQLWATVIKAGVAAGVMTNSLAWAARAWASQPVLLVAPLGLAAGGLPTWPWRSSCACRRSGRSRGWDADGRPHEGARAARASALPRARRCAGVLAPPASAMLSPVSMNRASSVTRSSRSAPGRS